MMSASWLILLLPVAALSGWLAALWQHKSSFERNPGKKKLPSGYFRGLNFLLNEQSDQAVNAFETAIDNHLDTVELQLALGNLFRRRGELEKATSLHQNLLCETHQDQQLHALVLYELAQDYQKAGLFDRAENLYLELLEGSFQRQAACRHLLQIYEQEKEWQRAISIVDKQADKSSAQIQRTKSHYYSELAELAIRDGYFDKARSLIDTALSYDADNLRLMIQNGRIACAFNQHQQALIHYKKVVEINSLYVREVVALIANSYLALDDQTGLNRYLEYLIETHSSSKAMRLLADRLQLDSGQRMAESKLASWLRDKPSLSGVHKLLELKLADEKLAGRSKKDIMLFIQLLESVIETQSNYQCRQCGFCGHNFYWQCPSCRSWDSYVISNLHTG